MLKERRRESEKVIHKTKVIIGNGVFFVFPCLYKKPLCAQRRGVSGWIWRSVPHNKPGSFITTKSMQDQRTTYGLTRNSRNIVYVCLNTKLLCADEDKMSGREWSGVDSEASVTCKLIE